MEGRTCMVCGASPGPGLSVFPLPRSSRQRGAWLAALQDAAVQTGWLAGSSQYGVCEKHFNPQDIKRGRKPSLNCKAVPVCSSSSSVRKEGESTNSPTNHTTDNTTPDVSAAVPMHCFKPQGSPSCAVNSGVSGTSSALTEERLCLVCGRDGRSCRLVELLSVSPQIGKVPVSLQLAKLVGRAKREVLCVSVMICSRCEALVQEVIHLEEDLKAKKQTVKDMFEATLHCHKEKMKASQDTSVAASELHCNDALMFDSSPPQKTDDDSNSFLGEEKDVERSRKTTRRRTASKKYGHSPKLTAKEEPTVPDEASQAASKVKKKQKATSAHVCDECGSTFLCKQSLVAHTATHQKSWDCSVCGRYLTTKARLKAHLFKFHAIGEEKNKEVACQDCGKCFGTKAGLRYHRNVVHRVGAEYQCQHCDRVFHYHVPYRSHLLYAHGEKKVVCETCGEKFFTISKLNTHINAIHRSAQSWSCDVCQAKFTTHTAFRHHVNIKHLKVHHPCSYCGTQFRKKSSLLLHLWKHSVFICHLCRQNFPSGEDLRTHASTAHGRELGWRGRRKHGSAVTTQEKKLTEGQETAPLQKAPATSPPEQNEHVASVVINDLLMTAETYESGSLQPFSLSSDCEKLPEKVTYPGHDQLKKTLGMMETSRDLDPAQFGTVEVKSSSPDHMEMAPGVSLINVQILGDMEMSQSDALGDLKGSILDPEDPPHHHLPVDTRLPGEHLSVAPELEAPHPLETTGDHLEVGSLDAPDDHLSGSAAIQVPDTLEEAPGELHLDPHHECPPCPLLSIVTSMEADHSQLVEEDEATCLSEEGQGKGAEGDLHKQIDPVDPVDLEPFSVALGGKGEVQYQYVMYISAPGEDSSPG